MPILSNRENRELQQRTHDLEVPKTVHKKLKLEKCEHYMNLYEH